MRVCDLIRLPSCRFKWFLTYLLCIYNLLGDASYAGVKISDYRGGRFLKQLFMSKKISKILMHVIIIQFVGSAGGHYITA
jgi:hypothetical protein